jgi:hypothetical protein
MEFECNGSCQNTLMLNFRTIVMGLRREFQTKLQQRTGTHFTPYTVVRVGIDNSLLHNMEHCNTVCLNSNKHEKGKKCRQSENQIM